MGVAQELLSLAVVQGSAAIGDGLESGDCVFQRGAPVLAVTQHQPAAWQQGVDDPASTLPQCLFRNERRRHPGEGVRVRFIQGAHVLLPEGDAVPGIARCDGLRGKGERAWQHVDAHDRQGGELLSVGDRYGRDARAHVEHPSARGGEGFAQTFQHRKALLRHLRPRLRARLPLRQQRLVRLVGPQLSLTPQQCGDLMHGSRGLRGHPEPVRGPEIFRVVQLERKEHC